MGPMLPGLRTLLFLALVAATVSLPSKNSAQRSAAVQVTSSGFVAVPLTSGSDWDPATSPAYGTYIPHMETESDFGQLRILTSGSFPDSLQMRAAGFIDGYLTAHDVHDYWCNMKWWLYKTTNHTEQVYAWMQEQDAWWRQAIEKKSQLASQSSTQQGSMSGSQHTGDHGSDQLSIGRQQKGAERALLQQQEQQDIEAHDGAQGQWQADKDVVFWDMQLLLREQLDGLVEGYRAARAEEQAKIHHVQEATTHSTSGGQTTARKVLAFSSRGNAHVEAKDGHGTAVGSGQQAGADASRQEQGPQQSHTSEKLGHTSKERQAVTASCAADAPLPDLTLQDFLFINLFTDLDDILPMLERDAIAAARQSLLNKLQAKAAQPGQAKGKKATLPAEAPTAAAGRTEDLRRVLEAAGGMEVEPVFLEGSPAQIKARVAKAGHCSVLIKVTSDLSDILIGHNTWWEYLSLTRVYRHLTTQLAHPAVRAQQISFSGYPGMLASMDDFYIVSSGLVVTETSNDVYDLSLYDKSTNKAVLTWQRVRGASLLADSGASWADWITPYNSGTGNNQWMVVDLRRFEPGQALQPGLLTVVETLPGGVVVSDTTRQLERGYWPSYNIPYSEEVYNATGYGRARALVAARGGAFLTASDDMSYQVSPRAKIFRRDQGGVEDLASLKRLLRSNGWRPAGKGGKPRGDPFSPTPWDGLSCRGDLDPEEPDAYGAYDLKVTNYKMALSMQAEAINGPAWYEDGNGMPPFSWRDWPSVPHRGMRETYRTRWELQEP